MEREIKLWSGTKMYESDLKAIFTLDNIFKYASEDELRAIVSSIIGRLNENKKMNFISHNNDHKFGVLQENIEMILLDKDLDIFVKELRDVK